MKKTLMARFLVLIPLLGATPPMAQEPSTAASDPVVRELAGIQQALDDLVGLLESMRRNQDVDLILRRIELHERRLAPLERSLRGNEQDQIDTRQNITETEMWKSSTEDQIDELEREGIDHAPDDFRQQVVVAELEIERLQLRLQTLQQRQIELENSLGDGRDEIEVLDDLLRELLE